MEGLEVAYPRRPVGVAVPSRVLPRLGRLHSKAFNPFASGPAIGLAVPRLWKATLRRHHLRFMQPRGLGRRVSDEFTVPLCRTHHRVRMPDV
jgi:hypothetical protein